MPIVLSVSCHETEYILRSLAEPCDPFYQSCPLRSLQVTSNTHSRVYSFPLALPYESNVRCMTVKPIFEFQDMGFMQIKC